MREIQLQILDSSNSSLGVIELENFQDFPLTLTKAIGDLNDFTQRKSTYSLDFDLPKTQNNNQILFGVANVNGVNNSLNLLGRKRCNILVDSVQIAYGFIRIYESKYKDSYKANFTGGNGDWVELLSNVYLNQLEWTAETNSGTVNATETFSQARIDTVNGLDSDSIDIVYPYVIRDTISGIDSKYLRPQIYVRSIIKKMFAKIGYTVNSAFFDSEFMKGTTVGSEVYKGVTIDPNFIFTNSDEKVQASRLEATTTTNRDFYNNVGNTGNPDSLRIANKLNNYWNNEVQDTANAFNPVDSSYTAPYGGVFLASLKVGDYRYTYDYFDNNNFTIYDPIPVNRNGLFYKPAGIIILMVKNNISPTLIDGEIVAQQQTDDFGSVNDLPTNAEFNIPLLANDKLTVWIKILDDSNIEGSDGNNIPRNRWRFWLGLDSNLSVQPSSSISFGEQFSIW